MGWRPTLRTVPASVHAEASFLASEHAEYKRVGVTIDFTTVGADANGDKVLKAGTVLGKITSSGKYGAYSHTASDGRQTATGFLTESINLRDGDIPVGMLIHGSVLEARVSGLDSSARTQLLGQIIFQ